ncbi:hypothetical protein [Rossellomorea aquimaris]|uniref:hypothetical protein n=1 Tax=Rossellomorea aquimaris TaxID=189382 RepID=UPI001CFDD3CF|nr:hypothetical protein [Rossellomorea aquimaris]
MKTYTVDFVEGDKITLLERGHEEHKVIVEDEALSRKLTDGMLIDLMVREDGSVSSYKILTDETKQVKEQNQHLLDKILKKSN